MNIPITKKMIARLILISIGSFLLVSLLPPMAQIGSPRLDFVSGTLAVVILGFLIFHAAERRRRLFQTINLELNKLRRIYHLSKNLSEVDAQRYRGWFTELHGLLYKYLVGFTNRDFTQYEESDKDFRALSYHVYKIPELRSSKEESLYDELLRTIAVVAESRQRIKESKESQLSAYSWLVVMLLVLNALVTTWLSMDATDIARVATGVVIAGFLFAVDLLWEIDTLSSERKTIVRWYVENTSRIELRRHDVHERRDAAREMNRL